MYKKLCVFAALAAGAVTATVPTASYAEEVIWSAQNYGAAWSIYNRKYSVASEALRRSFPGNDSALAGKQVQDKNKGWGVEPPRAVAHAANVDLPVRGMLNGRVDGQTFIHYLQKPDVHQWYGQNFGLH